MQPDKERDMDGETPEEREHNNKMARELVEELDIEIARYRQRKANPGA